MDRDIAVGGRKLAGLRKESFLTQEELARHLEMSVANVRRLEQSERGGMRARNFRRLAQWLSVTPAELQRRIGAEGHGSDSGDEQHRSGLDLASLRGVVEVDHYHGVSAARTEDRAGEVRDRVMVPIGSKRQFCVTVDGDCMQPKYQDGDVVLFSVDAAERDGIVEGRNYFIQLSDGTNTFKRIFFDPQDPEMLVLQPWNPRFVSRRVARSEVRLLARAVYRLQPDA